MADNLVVPVEAFTCPGNYSDSMGDTMENPRDPKSGPIAADIESLHQELQCLFERGNGGERDEQRRSDQQSAGSGMVIRGK